MPSGKLEMDCSWNHSSTASQTTLLEVLYNSKDNLEILSFQKPIHCSLRLLALFSTM